MQLEEGSDQLVRVVDVRVGDKILKQSVSRISPLEFANTDGDLRTSNSDLYVLKFTCVDEL